MEPRDTVVETDPEYRPLDRYDNALLSIAERLRKEPVPAYDYESCIRILM